MGKNVKTICWVLAGLAIFTLVLAWFGLLLNVATAREMAQLTAAESVNYLKATSGALLALLVPLFVCIVLNALRKKRVMKICLVALCGLIVVVSLLFIFLPTNLMYSYNQVTESISQTKSTVIAALQSNYLQILAPAFILGCVVGLTMISERKRPKKEEAQ